MSEANTPPRHIAIIMDGNGRWAKKKGWTRSLGHEQGVKTVRAITEECARLKVEYLTLYAFSTENWRRPKAEVSFLMRLLSRTLQKELPLYLKNNIRFETIGDLSPFSDALKRQIASMKEQTAHLTALTQVLALNYGSKDEITRACATLLSQGTLPTVQALECALDTAGMPPVDLLVRTGGELRLSNFLLWQAAYAELFFTPTLWPDFTTQELGTILSLYALRERRFGGVEANLA